MNPFLRINFLRRMKQHDDTVLHEVSLKERAGEKGKKLQLYAKSTTFTHIYTHIQKRYWPKHMCPVTFHYPAGLLSSEPLRLSRHCVIWGRDAERVYMCYSNNRNSLYYSWFAGKTYGGINLVTVLFNITSPGLGTPQQLENGANHSIKQTAMSNPIYSVLNTIECYYFEDFPQPFIRHSGVRLYILGNVIVVYLIYFDTCMFYYCVWCIVFVNWQMESLSVEQQSYSYL